MAFQYLNEVEDPTVGKVASDLFGDAVRDNFEALINDPDRCLLERTTTAMLVANNVDTTPSWWTTVIDPQAMKSAGKVVAARAGFYEVTMRALFDVTGIVGARYLILKLNGAQYQRTVYDAGNFTTPAMSTTVQLVAGDELEFWVRHTHGSVVDVELDFQVFRVGS